MKNKTKQRNAEPPGPECFCANHPKRPAFTGRHGRSLCYECAYGREAFLARYPAEFYDKWDNDDGEQAQAEEKNR